ncbi:methyltransferase domain-containing protein [Rhodobacterales bacterium HKCCE3408]|nr:methyltransferase domain-containing protein [Rhodobacterales bacterium HKCCE3408]
MGRLAPGAFVLDLGCGPGDAAAQMQAAGFAVDALDASAQMVEIARSEYGLDARQGDFADLRGPYDGVWASFSLLHMPRAVLPMYLYDLAAAMRPDAPFHIALKAGNGERRDGLGRLYSYFGLDEVDGWLRDAGFAPGAQLTGEGTGLADQSEPWFAIVAHRTGG